jgi:hypothetical protein
MERSHTDEVYPFLQTSIQISSKFWREE